MNTKKLIKFPEDGVLFERIRIEAIRRGIDANKLIIGIIDDYYHRVDQAKTIHGEKAT